MSYLRVALDVILAGLAIWGIFARCKAVKNFNKLKVSEIDKERIFNDNMSKLNRKLTRDNKLIRVLFIDDEDYGIVEELRSRGVNVFFYGSTMKVNYVEQCEPFDIIFVDLKGVASSSFTKEGLSYAHSVKKRYPSKTVVLYSSGSIPGKDSNSSIDINELDGFLAKHTDTDMWIHEIEKRIDKYTSIEYQIDAFGKLLTNLRVKEDKHTVLKTEFEQVLKTKNLNEFSVKLVEKIDDIDSIQVILEATSSLLTIVGGSRI